MEENVAILEKEFANEIAKGEHLNRFDLYRGLQGHNNDVNYVKKHLRQHMRFLQSVDWEKFERHPVVHQYFPYGFVGPSGKNDDNFVYIETAGRADPDGILKSAPISTVLLNRLMDMETTMKHLRRHERETGRQAKILFVFDMEHFALDISWMSILNKQFKVISKFFSDRYSEVLDRLLVVNCPTVVYYFWRLVQPILPEMTRKKVEIFGDGDWRQHLLRYVTADRLPVYWGGALVDQEGDSMCRSLIVVPPGKVPPELYWRPTAEDAKRELRHLPVPAGSGVFVDVHVTAEELQKAGQRGVNLRWYFTTDGDFSFGVFYTDSERQPVNEQQSPTVYPFFEHLPGPTIVPEMDQIWCRKPGWYKFRFGNEMAWWLNLNVYYQIIKC